MSDYFILHHTYGESESESYKLLGVFGSISEAQAAIEFYINLPGFCDYPDGFNISRYETGERDWTEGFEPDQYDVICQITDKTH